MIVAIDGTNWIHALWHTVGDRAPTLAAERLKAVCNHAADMLAMRTTAAPAFPLQAVTCWDRRSFRHDAVTDYKAGRPDRDPGIDKALAAAPDAMSKDSIPLAVAGFEADDLIASLATVAIASGRQCIMCSADKDLFQCLRAEKVTLLRNFKTERVTLDGTQYVRMYESEWCTEADLTAPPGLTPKQWIDYQCLVGEAGDNVKGCPGWGPVHSQAALQKCGSIDHLFKLLTPGTPDYNPWAVPGVPKGKKPKLPVRLKNLLAWQDQYPATRRLIELRTDVLEVLDALR